ncbi:MAG: VWA domain-containing protein [Spirochaetaceae bacterium]|nr:VWA domain-containing protein [Spirochaetaceae bacterium]MDT8298211.1 VWA domain-containing protein [Spirochaetaceae bacterium]
MLNFNVPGWFALFLIFPMLVWARFLWRKRGGRVPFPFDIWGGDGFRKPRSWLTAAVIFTDALYWLGAAALVVALAGPEITERDEVHLSRGIDIMIVLDQSPSMAAEDFPPVNRFDTAREMIRRFIDGRSGDSIGLVSFGSEAVLRCPPTADFDWLSERLDELAIRDLGDDTAIGMGLAVAALHLANSTASEKIILLLTDGDDNAGEIRPETAARLAAGKDIRIYSIGIGSEEEVPIVLENSETGVVTRGTIVTRFDEEQLRSLAETTGGGYWRANSPGSLETVLQSVDALEAVERRVTVRVNSRPLHRPVLIFGASLVLMAYLSRKFLMGESP